MPSNYTPNYQLNQWAAGDRVLRTDFNADNAKLDAALGTLASGKGNCQIVTGTYTGNGRYSQVNARTLTFDHKPLVLLISSRNVMITARGGDGYILGNGDSYYLTVEWGENSVSWYTTSDTDGAFRQMNVAGWVYTYVALLQI